MKTTQLGFARESREPLGVCGKDWREHLDGDVALQPRVPGAIHLAMPPAPSDATISYGPRR